MNDTSFLTSLTLRPLFIHDSTEYLKLRKGEIESNVSIMG